MSAIDDIRAEAAATKPSEYKTLAAWVRRDKGRPTHFAACIIGQGGGIIECVGTARWEIIPRTIDASRLAVLEARATEVAAPTMPASFRDAPAVARRVREALGMEGADD